jgi:hypothetical protein
MKFLKRFSNDVQLCKTENNQYVLTDGWLTSHLSFNDGRYQHDGQFKLPVDACYWLDGLAWQLNRRLLHCLHLEKAWHLSIA